MLPCVLLAAAFGVPQDPAADVLRRTVYRLEHPTSPWRATGGTSAVPVQYAVHVWGDPQHLRNYPWGGVNPLMPKVVGVPANPFATPEKPQRPQPAPVPPARPDR